MGRHPVAHPPPSGLVKRTLVRTPPGSFKKPLPGTPWRCRHSTNSASACCHVNCQAILGNSKSILAFAWVSSWAFANLNSRKTVVLDLFDILYCFVSSYPPNQKNHRLHRDIAFFPSTYFFCIFLYFVPCNFARFGLSRVIIFFSISSGFLSFFENPPHTGANPPARSLHLGSAYGCSLKIEKFRKTWKNERGF